MSDSTAPYPMKPTPWIIGSGPQQNVPLDSVPGLNTSDLDTSQSPIPFWDELQNLEPTNANIPVWDQVQLAGQVLPGLCSVSGGRSKRFDVKKAKGKNFATLTHQGFDPAMVKVTQRIWTPQQLYAVWLMQPIIQPLSATLPPASSLALDIYHPALVLEGVTSVVVSRTSFFRPVSGLRGVWEREIDFQEWNPEQKTNVTNTPTSAAAFVRSSPKQQATAATAVLVKLPGDDLAFIAPLGN